MGGEVFNAMYRLKMLRVADVMCKDVTVVAADAAMADVAQMFVDGKVSAAPVVDNQRFCVGVLSASDFLRRDAEEERSIGPEWDTAESFMTPAVQSISSEERLLTAAKIMCAQHVHRLFVLDAEGRPVGVVSTMDVVAALVNVIAEMESSN